MHTFRKIVRASRKRGKKAAGLLLSQEDVRALAGLQEVQERARIEVLSFCARTRHRKQRSGLCTCTRGW